MPEPDCNPSHNQHVVLPRPSANERGLIFVGNERPQSPSKGPEIVVRFLCRGSNPGRASKKRPCDRGVIVRWRSTCKQEWLIGMQARIQLTLFDAAFGLRVPQSKAEDGR